MSSSETQQALVLTSKDEPLSVQKVPIPRASSSSVVVKILATNVAPMSRGVFTGKIPFPMIPPIIPGSTAVGRIHDLGPDATSLTEGQLVFADFFVRSRDDPDASILLGYFGNFDPGSQKLMDGEWRNGSFAEYAKFPLDNVYPLNEDILTKQMGYSLADLTWLGPCIVSAGGLMEINIHAGDTVIVAPATGYFGGGAVHIALGMGAIVIAAARNEKVLARMAETFESTGRFSTVKLTGEVEVDAAALKKASGSPKGADAYIDWSPPAAAKTTHIQACLGALKPFGRCVIMGAIFGNIEIPYWHIVSNSIRIQGRYMFEKAHALRIIKLVESGLMKLGEGDASGMKVQKGFKLGDIEKAMDEAEVSGWGNLVVLEP
ncbi:MAG: hypothetical protein Q9190_000073 [Brigantiaea leucoxantha]